MVTFEIGETVIVARRFTHCGGPCERVGKVGIVDEVEHTGGKVYYHVFFINTDTPCHSLGGPYFCWFLEEDLAGTGEELEYRPGILFPEDSIGW